MTNPPSPSPDSREQRVVTYAAYVAAGMFTLGTFLDGLSNVSAYTWGARLRMSVGLVLGCGLADLYVRRGKVFWRVATGSTRVLRLGIKPWLAVFGAVALLLVAPDTSALLDRLQGNARPKAELLLIASNIERDLRTFMAATGFHTRVRPDTSVPQMVGMISETWRLKPEFRASVTEFYAVRERVNRGFDASEEEINRAISSGHLITKTLSSLIREKKVVLYTGVPLYSDAQGKQPLVGVWGLILENTSSDGLNTKTWEVFPTTRTHYQVGDEVTWDWNLSNVYGEAWYQKPGTEELVHAWEQAGEFIGRPLPTVNRSPR